MLNKKTIAASYIYQMLLDASVLNVRNLTSADAEIVDFDDVHYEQRIIKSPAEIEILKTNWEMVSKTFEAVVPKIKVGMTERQVQAFI